MTTKRSNRRQKQAAATRQDILDAARRLFATKGYVATSMAAIAEEAETAVQTIYDSVGPKRAIILAMVEHSEERAGVAQFRERIMATRDSRQAIALFVGLTRQFMEHGGDIFMAMLSAAPTEPDVAEAWQQANRNHRTGAQYVAEILDRTETLNPDVPVERAADVIAALTWGTTWQQFLRHYGWSLDECEHWLSTSLVTLLLAEPS